MLRQRGQHQDTAEPAGGRRRHDPQAAQPDAVRDDRRRGPDRHHQRLSPVPVHLGHRLPWRRAVERAATLHSGAGARRQAGPCAGVPPFRRGALRADGGRAGADPSRARRAGGLRQDGTERAAQLPGSDRGALPRQHAGHQLPGPVAAAVRDRTGSAPAAGRNHRDPGGQHAGQRHGAQLRQPDEGRDRCLGSRSGLLLRHGPGGVRSGYPVARHRRL
ncbi:hypothetical protein D3C84_372760 [compost metagenome]